MSDFGDLQVLANILAAPGQPGRQRQQDTIDRAALMSLGGVDPSQVDQFIPPPSQPGLFEKVLSPVGTLGTVLSSVLGRPVAAPRLDMEKVGAYSAIGKAQRNKNIGQTLAQTLKNPSAIAAAQGGDIELAMKLEHGDGSGGHSYSGWIETTTDPGASPEAKARAQQNIRMYQGGQIGMSAARAEATQPTTWENQDRSQAQAKAIRDQERNQRRQRSFDTMEKVYPGLLDSMGLGTGIKQQSAPESAPVDLGIRQIADPPTTTPPANAVPPSDLPRPDVRIGEGGATLSINTPNYLANMQLLASRLGIPLNRRPTAEEAAKLQDADKYLKVQTAEELEAAKSLPAEEAGKVAGLRVLSKLMQSAKDDFTPAERAKYTGYLRMPAQDWMQIAQTDPRFIEWKSLMGQIEAGKTDFLGKQITGPELALVKKFIPDGYEWGGAPELEGKINAFLRTAPIRVQQILDAHKPAGQLRKEVESELQSDPVTAAKRRLGLIP
jgi:hypothetical protein